MTRYNYRFTGNTKVRETFKHHGDPISKIQAEGNENNRVTTSKLQGGKTVKGKPTD